MEQPILTALTATQAFSEEDFELLEAGEQAGYGLIQNWTMEQFREVLDGDPAKAYVAHHAVSTVKAGDIIQIGVESSIPEFPPYLERGADGKPVGYDPHDPSQFWISPGGERYRWDGKGRGEQGGRLLASTKELVPNVDWPYGRPHRVAIVQHRATPDGVLIPDLQQSHDANAQELDWFHRGYNCWIGMGGKPYGDVDPETRRRVISAQERYNENDAPLVRRPPRAVAV